MSSPTPYPLTPFPPEPPFPTHAPPYRTTQLTNPIPPPPQRPDLLPPQTVLQAHLSRPLTSTTSHLNAKLQNTQSDNERLFDEVTAQRAEIEALVARLETVSDDVDSANGLLAEVVGEIAREGRDREAMMEG